MNEIIKSIEAEQLKETVDQFNVGDTVIAYAIYLYICLPENSSNVLLIIGPTKSLKTTAKRIHIPSISL